MRSCLEVIRLVKWTDVANYVMLTTGIFSVTLAALLYTSTALLKPNRPHMQYPHQSVKTRLDNFLETYQRKKILRRKPESIDNLVLNTENKTRHIVKKNELEGINDMKKLLSQPIEEGWAYLPDKGEWHETVFNEHVNNYGNGNFATGGERDLDYLMRLGKDNKKITSWHIHPERSATMNKGLEQKETDFPSSRKAHLETSKTLQSIFKGKVDAKPSDGDLCGLMNWVYHLHLDDPEIEYKEKIASEYGITEYKLTQNAEDHLDSTDGIFDLEKYQFVPKDSDVKYMPDGSINIKSYWVEIKFTPYEKGDVCNPKSKTPPKYANELIKQKQFDNFKIDKRRNISANKPYIQKGNR